MPIRADKHQTEAGNEAHHGDQAVVPVFVGWNPNSNPTNPRSGGPSRSSASVGP